MNKTLLLSLSLLVTGFSSCKKEDDKNSIPESYYGTYSGHCECDNPSGSYQPKITISERNSESVWVDFGFAPPQDPVFVGMMDGNKIEVLEEGSAFGSGTFGTDKLTLTMTIGTRYCTYAVTK